MRWLLVMAAVAGLGCEERVYSGLPGTRPPGDQAGYREGREDAIGAARIAAEVACDRLWSDCSSLCDDPFVYCGNSEDQCVDDYALGAVEDLTYPVYSRDLAEACADQLGERSCLDLDPNSPACESAVLEGCPGDEDGYGRPYSWLAATLIDALPTTLRPHLCEGTREYFALELEAGEQVALTLIGGTASAWISINAPVGAGTDREDVEEVGHSIYVDPTRAEEETQLFDAVPTAGYYFLEIDLNQSIVGDLEIAIGTDRRAPPTPQDVALTTEKIVYGALCERLHSDCADSCSDVDFFCGATPTECTDAYALSAVEQLFDTNDVMFDRAKATACAAELAQRACGDLGSAGSACGDLLVTQCAADPGAYGRPWAGRMAKSAALPATLELDLCESIGQFFRVDLTEGDRLGLVTDADPPLGSAWAYLYPPMATSEDLEGRNNYLFFSFYLDTSEDLSDPVPFTGSYYLETEYGGTGPVQLMLWRE